MKSQPRRSDPRPAYLVNWSGDVVSGEGTQRRSARGDEGKEGNRLLVAGYDRDIDRDNDFVREQDPLRLELRVVERADPR
jgi:hypothetical protein